MVNALGLHISCEDGEGDTGGVVVRVVVVCGSLLVGSHQTEGNEGEDNLRNAQRHGHGADALPSTCFGYGWVIHRWRHTTSCCCCCCIARLEVPTVVELLSLPCSRGIHNSYCRPLVLPQPLDAKQAHKTSPEPPKAAY